MIKSILLVTASLLLVACTPKIQRFGAETGEFVASFDHYAINVDDVDESVAFYQNVLGLAEIYDGTGKDNIRWLSLGNGMSLHIIETDRSKLRLQKGVHLAVSVLRFEEFVAHLRKIELDFETWMGEAGKSNRRPDGVLQVYFQDPDGYWIEVNNGRTLLGKTKRTAKR